jgi:hypothetical protein
VNTRSEIIASYGYGPSEYWHYANQAERDKAASTGAAMPDGRFPIFRCEGKDSVDSAIGLARTDAERKHTITRAKSLGCSSKIPDSWNGDGSHKEDTSAKLAVPPPPPPTNGKPPAPDAKAPEPPKVASPVEADAAVADAIAHAIALQEKDPDTGDPLDDEVMKALQAAQKAQAADSADAAKKAGETQDGKPPVVAAGAIVPPPPPPKPDEGGERSTPVDSEGNVDDAHKCTRPDCQHLASAHEDTDQGKNTGACQMQGCDCPEMKVDTSGTEEENPESQEPNAGETGNSPETPNENERMAPMPADAPPMPGAGKSAPEPALNEPPQLPGSDEMGPAFTIPVGVIENQPTGDGRQIASGALTWRIPPLPLMFLKTETHDPSGMAMNDPAVIAGRIDSLERKPGEGETQVICAKGFYLPDEHGMAAAAVTEGLGRAGISADIAVQESEISMDGMEGDDIGAMLDGMQETLTAGTIMGFTQVPFAAFEGAYIVLGDGSEPAEARMPEIQQRSDDDSVEAKELPPSLVASPHFMTYAECEACEQGLEVLTASGGPMAPPAAWFEDPGFHEDDGRLVEVLGRNGRREDKYGCPFTVTDDGRVFGHIALWGICHTGKSACVTAPKSRVDYAHFKRGKLVTTAEGEQVRCGTITADTGHANHRLTPSAAMAHYDNTALQAADVNIGEDAYGIWVAGALRPSVTEQQIRNLRSESVSGDWRYIGGQLELVAALAVPLPGFPLVVIDHEYGQQATLTAAGAIMPVQPVEAVPPTLESLTAAMAPLLPLAKAQARESMASLRN